MLCICGDSWVVQCQSYILAALTELLFVGRNVTEVRYIKGFTRFVSLRNGKNRKTYITCSCCFFLSSGVFPILSVPNRLMWTQSCYILASSSFHSKNVVKIQILTYIHTYIRSCGVACVWSETEINLRPGKINGKQLFDICVSFSEPSVARWPLLLNEVMLDHRF